MQMKWMNRFITVAKTVIATALISTLIINLIILRASLALFIPVFLISLAFVLIAGTPVALGINYCFKDNTWRNFGIKLILHVLAGLIIVAFFFLLKGSDEVFSSNSVLFYLSGAVNSIVYLSVLSLLKLSGDTDL